MYRRLLLVVPVVFLMGADGCDDPPQTADQIQKKQQEKILQEATKQTGMPAIVNFQERKNLKRVIELRDQAKLRTYTYLFSEQTGKLTFFCDSIGFGIPYATQYTNPMRPAGNWETQMQGNITLPQADPNGLYSPASAEGTWVLCLNPKTHEDEPVYIEPRIITSPFPLQ